MPSRKWQRVLMLGVGASLALGSFTFMRGQRPAGTVAPDSTAKDTIAGADSIRTTDPVRVVNNAAATPDTPGKSGTSDSAAASTSEPASTSASAPAVRYRSGEDPDFATKMGWPVEMPAALPGSILPANRIVAYYGNPLSKRMGALGEYEPDEMLRRLEAEVEKWRKADPSTPVQPALHLIAVVAQGDAGPSGKFRTIMRDSLIEVVYGWAKSKNAILFLDIQTGHSDIRELLPRFDKFLSRPDVHLGIDPEFMMKSGHKPGAKIGTTDAADVNYAASHLAQLTKTHNLPPKILVVHRFTKNGVTNASNITLRPEVQLVMHMDGWGAPWLKRDSYKFFIVKEPVQFTGFKLFYHNDTKKGDPLMTPDDLLKLRPVPLYIQYQ
jgi:hypothetical protein